MFNLTFSMFERENFHPTSLKKLQKLFKKSSSLHLSDFLKQSKITAIDRCSVIEHVLNKTEYQGFLVEWAIYCAEDVLPIFEQKCLKDRRPRLAISAVKNFQSGLISKRALEQAANSANATEHYVGFAATKAVSSAIYDAWFACHATSAVRFAVKAADAVFCTESEKWEQYFAKLAKLVLEFEKNQKPVAPTVVTKKTNRCVCGKFKTANKDCCVVNTTVETANIAPVTTNLSVKIDQAIEDAALVAKILTIKTEIVANKMTVLDFMNCKDLPHFKELLDTPLIDLIK